MVVHRFPCWNSVLPRVGFRGPVVVSIGIAGAFLAGVLSLISPCSALLLPAFFAYAFRSLRHLAGKTFVFFLGLCATLIPVGMGLAAILNTYRDQAIVVGGWLIIGLGVYVFFGGGFSIPGVSKLTSRTRGEGLVPIFFLGAVYGFAGFCAGPLLGAVLTTAAVSGSAGYGALIMTFYAAGLALPLFLLAVLWDRFNLGSARWLRGRDVCFGPVKTNSLSMISGVLFVVIGYLFISSNGAANLPTLFDIDAQFSAQNWAREFSAKISDSWVLCGICALGALVSGIKAARTRV